VITARFLQTLEEELDYDDTIPSSECRCQQQEKNTFRRCLCERNHVGACKFTRKDSMSKSSVENIVKLLTHKDIKSLSGLDDVRVVKGTENFRRLKKLSEKLAPSVAEHRAIAKRIDAVELFYITDYVHHLERSAEFKCCCLTCGYQDADAHVPRCSNETDHKRRCKGCAEGYAVIEELRAWLEVKRNDAAIRSNILKRQELDQFCFELDDATACLTEYRGHLARHKSEALFDLLELENLPDNRGDVTSDWKMKILSLLFRKNQARFFGKKGTSGLGFMVVMNSTDPDARARNEKECEFIIMLTADTCQDEISVICAKSFVYSDCLPDRIDEARFQTDGAGYFSSKLNRAVQPLWEAWTGVKEVILRITPAGAGKTALDGKFGGVGEALHSAGDMGFGYTDSDTIMFAVEQTNGVSATTFYCFAPDRGRFVLSADIRGWKHSILRAELDWDGMGVKVFRHSGYCNGFHIPFDSFFLFNTRSTPSRKIPKRAGAIDNPITRCPILD